MKEYDVIVIGLGGIGSATLWQLSQNGLDVAGVDKFAPPHDKGSSHGQTRIIRKAIFEGEQYLSLIKRSYVLWDELEKQTGKQLFVRTPAFIVGEKNGEFITSSVKGLPEDVTRYSDIQANEKFSQLHLQSNEELVIDESAGYLLVEKCVDTFLNASSADTYLNSTIKGIEKVGGKWEVSLSDATLVAAKIVYACGPWTAEFVSDIPLSLVQKTLIWTSADKMYPLVLYELPGEDVYSFPPINGEVKFARDCKGKQFVSMGSRPQETEEIHSTHRMLQDILPGLDSGITRTKNCVYSMTPDSDFIISTLEEDSSVIVLAGFSGHGYKYAPAIGELVSKYICTSSQLPIEFSLQRFKKL